MYYIFHKILHLFILGISELYRFIDMGSECKMWELTAQDNISSNIHLPLPLIPLYRIVQAKKSFQQF